MGIRGWRLAAIVLACVLAGVLLAGSGLLPAAQAQSEGRAGQVVVVLGQVWSNGYAPIVLLDSQDETLLVYEYSYQDERVKFSCARSYRFDKLVTEFNNSGPTVEQVRSQVAPR
jgi:hypothetical protein